MKDRVAPHMRVLFVGINPGIRSATTSQHFAGYSNRFWKLLYDSRLVPEPFRAEDDVRMPELGYGITNLVPRPTPGIDTLRPNELLDGVDALRRKVRSWTPDIVAFVGVTLFRVVFRPPAASRVRLGLQNQRFEAARVVVLPNPSGRNASFSYAEMLIAFRRLKRLLTRNSVTTAESILSNAEEADGPVRPRVPRQTRAATSLRSSTAARRRPCR